MNDAPPPTWNDRKGRAWRLELDTQLLRDVRKISGVDLPGAMDGSAWLTLARDHELFVQVLWLCHREQAEAMGVEEEEFGRGLAGDAFDRAFAALEKAWVLFYPAAQRRLAEAIIGQVHATIAAQQAETLANLQGPQVQEVVQSQLTKASQRVAAELHRLKTADLGPSGMRSTKPPPSPGSSPGGTRFGS
jgi:hypothetical protein